MYLPGVGPNKKDVLNKELGVRTWGDLLEYYPYKYVDRSRIYAIHELQSDMPFVQIRGKILSFEEFEMSARKKRVVAHFSDGRGVVDLVWFSGAQYIYKTYKVGEDYIVFGRPTVYGGRFQFSHPEIERASELQLSEMGMQPYYVTTEQMKKRNISSRAVEKMVKAMLQKIAEPIPETLPDFIVNARHLVSRDTALRCVHYPKNAIEMQKARERLKFEELFYVQLNILRYASDHRRKYRGYVFSQVGDDFHRFYSENLRFELTGAQKRVVHEIRDDMRSGRQMNRLLQGDVGSGKTLVALMTMLIALGNGYQACIMAPTEILAEQHFATIQEFLHGLDIRVELLTGQVKGKRRQEVLDALIAGEVKILVGTHAVLEDPVRFQRLGVAVIDEQHRFGVEQRESLQSKPIDGSTPHMLVMTATPIPRTAAMTWFGDLDISWLTELPGGRKPIRTFAIGMDTDPIDLKYARQTADYLGSEHHEVIINREMVLQSLEEVIRLLGTWDITTIRASMGMYLLCKAIHEQTDVRVLLTGEISDELFGYKYTDYAPTADAFQQESQKRIRELYMYDVLRADRCISANSIEARVPFGDLDFVRYVMAIDPEKKLNSYGKGKYLLRKAFEGDWLPPEILWREKAAFSDAVGHSMVDDIKEYAESLYTDEEFQLRRANYSAHCMPFTKESLFYREIFEKYYHDQSRTIVDFWMPNKAWPGCNVNDPSARVLANYGASGV